MTSRLVAFTLLALPVSLLIAQIAPPLSGVIRYGGSPITSVYGIPGNLITGPSGFGMADTISFSDSRGFIARDGLIRLIRLDGSTVASYDSTETSPLLNAGNDSTDPIAWLPAAHSLLCWDGKALLPVPVDDAALEGNVTSVTRLAKATAELLVMHASRQVSLVSISLTSGQLLSSDVLPGVQGPAFQFGAQRVWADEKGLEVDSGNSVRHTITVSSSPADLTAEQMSSHWIHFYSASSRDHWALHLGGKEPTLSRLPALLNKGGK